MSANDPLLALENVEVHFENASFWEQLVGEPDTVRAVDGITLELEENDVLVLVGESGCGKTTLGKTAIGLEQPTSGSVKYRGHDIWDVRRGGDKTLSFEEIRSSLQIIHQDPGGSLNPNRRVMKSLTKPLEQTYPDMDPKARRVVVTNMLKRVGMEPPEDYAHRYPHQLSGGEKQRIALIRALLMDAEVILADEAVSALDVSLRVEMMDLMLELQEEFGTSFIFISHNLSNARYLAKRTGGRIGVMYLGELVEIGPADEVLQNSAHPYTDVLKWATPNADPRVEQSRTPPMRKIDIPDPIDPPSGCRFHTRCPEAREACTEESPALLDVKGPNEVDHRTACFREYNDHAYWKSPELTDDEGQMGTDLDADTEAGAD